MSFIDKLGKNSRLAVQICAAALTNGYINGYLQGTIYKGTGKKFCVPGLNCYSCPGALGSCPIGSLQAVLGSSHYRFSFYIIGFLMAVGAFFGRFICGWLCPFGLVQDLLHKIPGVKKLRKVPGDRYLRYLKYLVLLLFVILLPSVIVNVAGGGTPWFCKLICPAGTLMGGILLTLLNPSLRSGLGFLFSWKVLILVLIVLASIKIYRPFCRYLCPLGAVYSVFNPIALYRFQVDQDRCTSCKACQRACPMGISVYETPNSTECIRCGKCLKACGNHSLTSTFSKYRAKKQEA
ncbi:MAG: 4Fe-4S binding protein [Blautia sp.]|jgi:ferredoxin-type protein NapH